MLIGDLEGLKYATRKGCGWRADCLGDMGGFSRTWCHMRDFYPQQIRKTGAADAWKRAPVAFETCWDMRKWKSEGWDIHAIFDFALKYHASYVNNKSAPIPEGTRPEVERLLRRLGYRLVLKKAVLPRRIAARSTFRLATVWENKGVAPPYRDYFLAVRLKGKSMTRVLVSSTSIKGWLPGEKSVSLSFKSDTDSVPGSHELAIGIVPRGGVKPVVRIAVEGETPDGWYPLGDVSVGR